MIVLLEKISERILSIGYGLKCCMEMRFPKLRSTGETVEKGRFEGGCSSEGFRSDFWNNSFTRKLEYGIVHFQ